MHTIQVCTRGYLSWQSDASIGVEQQRQMGSILLLELLVEGTHLVVVQAQQTHRCGFQDPVGLVGLLRGDHWQRGGSVGHLKDSDSMQICDTIRLYSHEEEFTHLEPLYELEEVVQCAIEIVGELAVRVVDLGRAGHFAEGDPVTWFHWEQSGFVRGDVIREREPHRAHIRAAVLQILGQVVLCGCPLDRAFADARINLRSVLLWENGNEHEKQQQ